MSERTDALEVLEELFESVVNSMPNDEFDSHQFILRLAHQHQQRYVQALAAFADAQYPFMVVHGEIAKRLKKRADLVTKIGEHDSEDIFRQKNSASKWLKVG